MNQTDFIGRALTGIICLGFLCAAIFDVLNYVIVKILLFGTFGIVLIYTAVQLYKNENHPKT